MSSYPYLNSIIEISKKIDHAINKGKDKLQVRLPLPVSHIKEIRDVALMNHESILRAFEKALILYVFSETRRHNGSLLLIEYPNGEIDKIDIEKIRI